MGNGVTIYEEGDNGVFNDGFSPSVEGFSSSKLSTALSAVGIVVMGEVMEALFCV